MTARSGGEKVAQQLTTEESMRFVSLRDVILTVKGKLLGANVKDAIVWLRKYLYPDNFRSRLMNGFPVVFVLSQYKGYRAVDNDIARNLYGLASSHLMFFQESCFDTHGYDLDRINLFFADKGIDIVFQQSIVASRHNSESQSNPIAESKPDHASVNVLFLNKFRNDDPLSLAIEIRNKEWVNFNPNDAESRANQESIVTELIGRGLSKNQAAAIEMVSCPIRRK